MKHFALITATLMPILGFVGAAPPTVNDQCAPSGTHLQEGSETCTCSDTTVDCTPFMLCGVGHINAEVVLTTTYSATVDCRNRGGNIVEVKAQVTTSAPKTTVSSGRNGCLQVPELSTSAPTPSDFEKAATCPNGNWTPVTRPGTIVVNTSTYTLTFAGFTCPYIEFTDICTA